MPSTPPRASRSSLAPALGARGRARGPRRLRGLLGAAVLAAFVLTSWIPGRGRASTVAEQRARLPPPAACKDPVAGVWKSHSYDDTFRDWTIFTLVVERVREGEDSFEGTITNDSWVAEAHESSPPVCRGELHYVISMDAEGRVQDGQINFWGVGKYRVDEVPCGAWNMNYNLDHFSGQIDPEIMEFQSVNNDGGRAINDPVVFRRVRCNEGESVDDEPRISVAPPPFYPPDQDEGGCGFKER
ncbi:hypothetical protein G6O69_34580 [Pseudenhygromyxa sp. WMMC2535]|uniref:hypothetical protein n=1 Tax=Pseudenhygromyxa sp. WMMC2535 TaxID=2712867 RepID=UPI001595411C|nr:hypothetical protein [Pseudenhygromyxa sp. WMMC2535]NVB43000.1 hypothetical protein [Pseudenhygromyxa sp. WMMC2535]